MEIKETNIVLGPKKRVVQEKKQFDIQGLFDKVREHQENGKSK